MKLLATLLTLGMTIVAHADTIENAKKAGEKLSYLVNDPGVSMLGVGGCDGRTGKETQDYNNFVYCVIVGASSAKDTKRLRQIYPVGTRIEGSFVFITTTGPIVPQPRVGGGN